MQMTEGAAAGHILVTHGCTYPLMSCTDTCSILVTMYITCVTSLVMSLLVSQHLCKPFLLYSMLVKLVCQYTYSCCFITEGKLVHLLPVCLLCLLLCMHICLHHCCIALCTHPLLPHQPPLHTALHAHHAGISSYFYVALRLQPFSHGQCLVKCFLLQTLTTKS